MTNDNLRRLLVFCVLFCFTEVFLVDGAHNLETKVSLLLRLEPEDPKCFVEGMQNLTCFWEEKGSDSNASYTFSYQFQNENSSECAVTGPLLADRKRLHFCKLPRVLFFVPLDLHVFRARQLVHKRSLFADLIFLLDPPANLTVTRTGKPGQLNMTWLPPLLKYLDAFMMYEVSYATAGSRMGKVEEVRGSTKLILQGLQPRTKYQVRVRVRPDGVAYSGYWSAWTDPVVMETPPSGMDPIIASLSLVISLFFLLLSLTIFLSHRRFLLKKLWPAVPTPESKFSGLFTVHSGDFQEWMCRSNGSLWWRPAYFYAEETPAPLEVLSEASLGPPLPVGEEGDEMEAEGGPEGERVDPGPEEEGWKREPPREPWLMEQLRAPVSLLESHDAYVTLNQHTGGEEALPLDDIQEEVLPLQTLFTTRATPSSTSHSDMGSLRQGSGRSGSGRLSSQSSFEYPNQTWPPRGPAYAYMAAADSGVSVDYSPMSTSQIADVRKGPPIYNNEIPAQGGCWRVTPCPTDADVFGFL